MMVLASFMVLAALLAALCRVFLRHRSSVVLRSVALSILSAVSGTVILAGVQGAESSELPGAFAIWAALWMLLCFTLPAIYIRLFVVE
jgi:hypothetical protein